VVWTSDRGASHTVASQRLTYCKGRLSSSATLRGCATYSIKQLETNLTTVTGLAQLHSTLRELCEETHSIERDRHSQPADMAALPRELDRAPWHVVDAKSTSDAPLHRIMIKAAFVGGGEHKSLDVIVFECGGGSTSVLTVPPRLWRGGVNAGDFMSEVTPPSHKLKQRSHSHHIACTTSCSMTCTRAPTCAHHPVFLHCQTFAELSHASHSSCVCTHRAHHVAHTRSRLHHARAQV
jgi:hypothetical protein